LREVDLAGPAADDDEPERAEEHGNAEADVARVERVGETELDGDGSQHGDLDAGRSHQLPEPASPAHTRASVSPPPTELRSASAPTTTDTSSASTNAGAT
jgi:hypothetical protein